MIRINNLISSFFVSLILLSSYNSIAVDNKMDSLRTALSKSREDTNKVKTLNTISWELSYTDLDSANQYCYQALELSKKINWARGTGASYHQIAWVNYQKGDYFKSLEFNQRALAIWDSMLHHGGAGVLSQVKNSKLKTLNNCGLVYWNIGDYPKAINNFFDALKIEEEISNTQMEANTLNNIGLIYLEQGDNPKAMDYFTQALRLAQKQGYKLLEANTLSNIGTIYYKQGEKNVSAKNSSGSTKEFTAALENFLKSIHIREEIGDDQGKAMDLGNVGSVYFSLHDYPNAIEYDKQTLKLAEEFGDKQLQSNTLENLGSLYTTLNDYRLGEKYLLEGLKLSDSIGDLQGRAEINQYLSELYSRMGNYRKSLESYKAAEIAKDSLFNMNKANEITRKEMNFEFDKKEAKAKAEQEQKEALAKKEIQRQKFIRNTFISGFIIVLLFAFVFFKQRNKIKLGKKHSDELLLNILPAEVAEELKAKGSAEAKQFNEVTVMFTDFKNFTSISEKLSPTELVAEIDYCFKAFDLIVAKYKIEKIKTIGDSYMAAGGLTDTGNAKASEVIQAALEIQDFINKMVEQKRMKGKEQFEIRIGIHTGPVVAGIVGIKKFAYDIWGDTVNIASRMESSSETGKINISGSTFELIKDHFICKYRGKVEAKNKGLIDMYFVEGVVQRSA